MITDVLVKGLGLPKLFRYCELFKFWVIGYLVVQPIMA